MLGRILYRAVDDLGFLLFPVLSVFLCLTHIHMYHPTIYAYHTPYCYALSNRPFCGAQQTFSDSFVWIILCSDDCINRYAPGTVLRHRSSSISIHVFLYYILSLWSLCSVSDPFAFSRSCGSSPSRLVISFVPPLSNLFSLFLSLTQSSIFILTHTSQSNYGGALSSSSMPIVMDGLELAKVS